MSFESILFETPADRPAAEATEAPGFFVDLNLDQVVEAVIKGRPEHNLRPLFWSPLRRVGAIQYRHEVMQEIERPVPARVIGAFAQGMRAVRDCLLRADRLNHVLQKQRWLLDAADAYCDAVTALSNDLSAADVKSRGLVAFREYVKAYAASEAFTSLDKETRDLKAALDGIEYCIRIRGNSVTVRAYDGEVDYSAYVEKTFERFKQADVKDYRARFPAVGEVNTVEATVLENVARLFPETFARLNTFCQEHAEFRDAAVAAFDREVQFYLAYLEFIGNLRTAGLSFCYPSVSDTDKEIAGQEVFDLALANKLAAEGARVVSNDFWMKGKERIFVVSGPNQGGKTTFARTFGQLHYLAALGCPVPGKDARLFLFDNVFTHFEKEENVEDLRSKLEDDLLRVHHIVSQATPRSIIIVNEILTSTTLNDAIFLGKKVMQHLGRLDSLGVWVTFVEELASHSEKTVSLISMVAPENPALRTYKIVRRPAHGRSYAAALAEKYGVTYGALKERIK